MRLILSTYQDFFNYCFNSLCFQLPQNVTSTDEITHMIRHKWGKVGPSYFFSENGDLSFLLSIQSLVGNIQGKFPKNYLATFISEVSP